MSRDLRLTVLRLAKLLGGFALARWLTRGRQRILCYHGISVEDQHEWAPLLFMRAETFERRMQALRKLGWKVISLDQAVANLTAGHAGSNTVVLTIDDGWVSTLTEAAPILRKHGLASTLYVTTYYSQRPADVFNVALSYMIWKTRVTEVQLDTGHAALDRRRTIAELRAGGSAEWIAFADANLTWQERQALLRKAAPAFGFDPDVVLAARRFQIVNGEEITAMARDGIDIQLHTHRHHLPTASFEAMASEVTENQKLLEQWKGGPCLHFCYPSGRYTLEQSEWLARMGLASSTTTDPGTNPPGTHLHRLRRILDRDDWSDIEFEAAMSGITELRRIVRGDQA